MSKGEKRRRKVKKKPLSERVRKKASERTSAWLKEGGKEETTVSE